MMSVFIVSFIAIFLVYLSKDRRFSFCSSLAFFILIVFFGFRYEFGNDYLIYYENFDSISIYDQGKIELEYGWILLNKLFAPLGFPALVFFITIIQFYSIYYYLNKFVDRNYRWFVLLFYILNVSLMIHSLSGMRQTMAMSIVIFSLKYIYDKRYLISFLIIIFAAQFHSSAYIMLFLPISLFCMSLNKKVYGSILIIVFLICFLLKDLILNLSNLLLQFDNVSKYEYYLDLSDSVYNGSGIGIILQMMVVVILLITDKFEKSIHSWTLILYQISFLFVPLYTILPMFNRIQMYFLLLGLGGTPALLKSTRRNPLYGVVIFLYLFMLLRSFSSVLMVGPYSNYRTIFN